MISRRLPVPESFLLGNSEAIRWSAREKKIIIEFPDSLTGEFAVRTGVRVQDRGSAVIVAHRRRTSPRQKTSFSPNCMMRRSRADVMVPKVELMFRPFGPGEKETFGVPRFVWLTALYELWKSYQIGSGTAVD